MSLVVSDGTNATTASTKTHTHGPRVGGSLLIQQETLRATQEQLQIGCEGARRATDRLFEKYGEELAELAE